MFSPSVLVERRIFVSQLGVCCREGILRGALSESLDSSGVQEGSTTPYSMDVARSPPRIAARIAAGRRATAQAGQK